MSTYRDYLIECLQYSEHEDYNFPLCATLINITGFVVNFLRDGKLTDMINAERSVINIMNNCYFALFFHFFKTYKKKKGTVNEIGDILKDCKDEMGKNIKFFINQFKKLIDKYYK